MNDVAYFTDSTLCWEWAARIHILIGDGFSVQYALDEAWELYRYAAGLDS